MTEFTDHALIFDNDGHAVAARCRCGGWMWGEDRSGGLLPLDAITAVVADHRRHVGEAGGREQRVRHAL